ncbi:MAG: TetR/AcrR family transcriptional regulator [Bacteroidales bacterium]|jgi:AcrR family transcriptional regulator|nr:TetR/AcrR family transcriptional regulator [Bacteroidales bacterium]HNV62571.1 TetR/AcrR family transcriptional regulator [Candidatus Cloacimonas acidaminovorans]MBK7731756.1 TetR/AcrR family transcriptional regulator [Bacteroidales bacterium]MBP8709120.1 TetR/AcrR family transcriptional regulator [Bacteroidales bacterium]MZQ79575.1 TetR family transcriptional regulator [Bacteroidales bacterium]
MSQLSDSEVKIIEAAKQVFLEKGLENAKMRDIADTAGISRTALNYYYRTKENLFYKIIEEILEGIIPHFESLLSKDTLSFQERLLGIIDVYADFLSRNNAVPRFVMMEMQRHPQTLFDFINTNQKVKEYLQLIHAMLDREAEEKSIKQLPMEELVTLFYGLLFVPYLVDPFIQEFFLNEKSKIEAYHRNHLENMKQVLLLFLSVKSLNQTVN